MRLFMVSFIMVSKDSIRCGRATSFEPRAWGHERRVALARSPQLVASAHGGECLPDALFKRLVRVHRHFGIANGFEAGFHFEVEREGSVVRRVRGIRFEVETAASG